MIESTCSCGAPLRAPESQVNQPAGACDRCGRPVRYISAETLPADGGAGDFDAHLVILKAPEAKGVQLLLGGVMDIEIGKLPEKPVCLPGKLVSRSHCRLKRIDFGPSRWRLQDNHSTNGLFVNGQRITAHELQHGDVIRIGEYELSYRIAAPASVVIASAPAAAGAAAHALPQTNGVGSTRATGGPSCPSCSNALPPGSAICIDCGIYVRTGRPLLTSQGFDENELHIKAENILRFLSWPIPTGFYPIASEAYGAKQPVTTWIIVGITVLASPAFLIAGWGLDDFEPAAGSSLMLWPTDVGTPQETAAVLSQRMTEETGLSAQELEQVGFDMDFLAGLLPRMDFQWHQLLTHALLHGDLIHLAGNMLFLIVFGMRVNALIGNAAMAVLYPILAIAGGAAHLAWGTNQLPIPMLGASGAVIGMAGIYLVLFPLHRVFMALWARWFLLFLPLIFWLGLHLSWTVFAVRGIWVVLFYIAFDVLYTSLGLETGVAHFAHLGGFGAGVIIATALLLTRVIHARGGDLLSVALGRHAWPLIGRPGRWNRLPDRTAPPVEGVIRYPS